MISCDVLMAWSSVVLASGVRGQGKAFKPNFDPKVLAFELDSSLADEIWEAS